MGDFVAILEEAVLRPLPLERRGRMGDFVAILEEAVLRPLPLERRGRMGGFVAILAAADLRPPPLRKEGGGWGGVFPKDRIVYLQTFNSNVTKPPSPPSPFCEGEGVNS